MGVVIGGQLKTTCKASMIPTIDLSDWDNAKRMIVEACGEFGFFKGVNHGVSMELVTELEREAVNFFKQSEGEKEKWGPPNPFGYGNKKIGCNGDVGWVEYLLFCTNPEVESRSSIPPNLRGLVNEYVGAVRNMACKVLEMIAEEMQMGGGKKVLSGLVSDDKSDSCFRLNHYPPCPLELDLVGFGEHTDPQIISVLRSNNIAGLQICLRDGTWLSVPSDHTSFFFNVGDALQVMTNGRFRSVKHRVMAGSTKSRVSMIYFGGPPLSEKIRPMNTMEEGEGSLYKEFTWSEYKKSAYKTRLGDNRLCPFQLR